MTASEPRTPALIHPFFLSEQDFCLSAPVLQDIQEMVLDQMDVYTSVIFAQVTHVQMDSAL